MEQLPLGDPALDRFAFESIERANAENAVAWARATKPEVPNDQELERLFAGEVRLESRRLLPACIPEAKEALAEWYARRVRADDAHEIAEFLTTGPGRALASSLNAEPFMTALRDCAYRGMFPKLEQILGLATESNAMRRLINSQGSGGS